uniref:Transthyretin-like family protein n=1 Tax=Wuchereria bancrofti TaxID=6293 RepID=A0A1I8EPG2_WUCBA
MWLIFSLSTYIVIVVVHTANAFLEQSVRVRGRLLCGSQPASSILVKLFDKDNGPNPDDLLDSCYTDSGGKFDLQGNSYELSTIDPEVRIYHDCNDYGRACVIHFLLK